MANGELGLTKVPAWFLSKTSIWGVEHAGAPPAAVLPDGEPNRRLAYEIALQLGSRIATNRLPSQAGTEARALQSTYELFGDARERVLRFGPDAQPVAALVWWMLNRDVRPFTAYWHRSSVKGLLETRDACRLFRHELEHLQKGLVAWAALFTRIANPELKSPLLVPDKRTERFHPDPIEGKKMATKPSPRDGLAVPTPFAQSYAELIARETELIEAWRAATGRTGKPLSGIALSGGGIRSATFSLGVLRQLALKLPVFAVDYISTVSGGGYLGSLIASAFQKKAICAEPGRGPLGRDDQADLGAAVIGWLRGRSRSMKVDARLVASVFGNLYSDGGVADEYEARLRDTWLIEKAPAAVPPDDLGPVIQGGASLKLTELSEPAPLQIWNMAVNVTKLNPKMAIALRGRHADLYSLSRAGSECRLLGYSKVPLEWTVERAMALSGAAVAPTTAAETPFAWALRLISVADLNLGRWIKHANGAEAHSLWRHIKMFFGAAGADDGIAFLSDGGHVENTALYQLLRRRCAFILAIDGEEDREMRFGGLMNLQHLARVEQQTVLDIDLRDVAPDASGRSDGHFTLIRVRYPKLAGEAEQHSGVILFVKLSLTGGEPEYLRAYKREHPEFPHHSTLDQDYDDRKFEAYLALGEHIGEQLVSPEWAGGETHASFESWMSAVAKRLTERD